MVDLDPAHDTITPIGTIAQNVSASSVNSLVEALRNHRGEDPALFRNLPDK